MLAVVKTLVWGPPHVRWPLAGRLLGVFLHEQGHRQELSPDVSKEDRSQWNLDNTSRNLKLSLRATRHNQGSDTQS